jgi:hypothetical protein
MKRLFYFRWYAFMMRKNHHNPKMLTKYFASVGIFGKQLDFRFMTQANTWFFRCENLYAWRLKVEGRIRYGKDWELPF